MWQIVCSQNDHSNISAHKSSFIYLFIYLVVVVYFLFIYLFCQTSKRIRHRYTYAPHPEPSFLLPPHTIPLGRPSAPAPSIQYRASNLTGNSFHTWYYTCFNAILPNLPTLSLSNRVLTYSLIVFFPRNRNADK